MPEEKGLDPVGWVDQGHIRIAVYIKKKIHITVYLYYIFILVKIDKDKRLVVLDEELEVCFIS